MKKKIIIFLILVLAITLFACSPNFDETNDKTLIIPLSRGEQNVLGVEKDYLSITLINDEVDLDELKENNLISKSDEKDAKVLIELGKKVVNGIKKFYHEDIGINRQYGVIIGRDIIRTADGSGQLYIYYVQLPNGEIIISIGPEVPPMTDDEIDDLLDDIIDEANDGD